MARTLEKLNAPLAPFIPGLELDAQTGALLEGVRTASEGVTVLEEAGKTPEAARLIAHALPKREAVWWACMCARGVPDPSLAGHDVSALEAAEAWVRKPADDQLRRASWEAAQRTAFKTPEAWAAVAVFWSGGSIAPPGQPVVPPADHLTGVAVSGAVVLASVRVKPAQAPARLLLFLASAKDIANGGAGWIKPEEA